MVHHNHPSSHGGGGLVKDSFLREMTFTVLWKDSGPTDLAFRCTCDGPPMTRPYNHGWGLAKHSFRREMTLTMLWKDSRHSSAPTDLLFRCTRDGPNMTRPSSHVGGGVGETFVPKRNDIHRAVEGFRTQFWTHQPCVRMVAGWSSYVPSVQSL
ncbi:hypothetical protein TNCT_538631 [Trichonephila clavata]|uniref:Uncharacterized protein n=1 Tax=Trichonephila clavata TaxID=2740835 RepID=A0A8X6EZB9_TRICU|nr:hypothetical protein TNCT_538631 [Trichonephila clavata]